MKMNQLPMHKSEEFILLLFHALPEGKKNLCDEIVKSTQIH